MLPSPEMHRVLTRALLSSVKVVKIGLPRIVYDMPMPPYHFQPLENGSAGLAQKVKP